ncbi:hypothetical protein ACIRVF_08325 [Kitasatospora sp. NPDC101157]|uniref:hypothetical protein n=1 Tax=Kitasatospora sp. NPDC101157 TaxID=3364098 RepID=UPI0037FC217B
MPLVRTTFFPDPVEVPDDEVQVLRAQGLLVEETAPQPAVDPAPAKQAPKPKEDVVA